MTRMSKKAQVDRIKKIIMKDANTTGMYINKNGKMCALGGLAYYGAGASKKELHRAETGGDIDLMAKITRTFPILTCFLGSVAKLNDSIRTTKPRRKALCEFFDSLL